MDKWVYMMAQYKKKIIVGGIICVLLMVMVIGGLFRPKKQTEPKETAPLIEQKVAKESSEQAQVTKNKETVCFVDVKGAIMSPGMYEIKENMRVLDAVEKAGGFTKDADKNRVNFSQLLEDQMVIYVPKIGEEVKDEEVAVADNMKGEKEEQKEQEKININTADALTLQQLNGIGEKKAEEIVRYREEHGSFKEEKEMTKVKGIGEKTYESLKELITIR